MATVLIIVLAALAILLTFVTWCALVVAKRSDEWVARYWDDEP